MARNLWLRNAVLLILALAFGSIAFATPAISTISPTAGPVSPVGSPITINGSGFGTTQGSSTVTIGGVTTTPTSWSNSRIVAPVPSALLPGFMDVIVTVGGTASNAASFLVIPTITGATPLSAPTGASVTITGTSFGDSQGSSTVTFQDIPVTPSAWSNTSITLQVPDAAYDGPIVVTVNDFATNGLTYTVTPNITGISPTAAPVGAMVTVSGTAFQPNQNFSPVTFNGVSATPVAWSNTSFTVSVPSGATTGPVVATVNNIASNGMPFIVTHPTSFYLTADASTTSGLLQLRTWGEPRPAVSYPSVDLVNQPTGDYLIQAFDTPAGVPNSSDTWQSILPAFLAVFMKQTAGTPGTLFPKFELFLNGPSGIPICSATSPTALTTSQKIYSLSCNPTADITVSPSDRYYLWVGVNSTATSTTSTQFQLTIGPGGGRLGGGDVFLNVPIAAHIPTISGSDSQYYTAGAPFSIAGSDFGTTTGTVTFNGETAVVSSWSDTSITALVPNDAFGRSSNITVFNANSVQSNPWGTTVVAAINSLTPASGGIGTSVVISGSGFGTSIGSVFFGGGTTGIVTNWSDTSITATVPSGTITGSVYVLPADIAAFMSNPFIFTVTLPPSISSLSPAIGAVGTIVVITGTDFGPPQGTVTFNGIPAAITSWSDTSISTSVPTGATSGDVIVTANGQKSSSAGFIVPVDPVLSARFSQTSTSITLTSSSALDWEHWGTSDDSPTVRMAGTLPIISDLSVIGAAAPSLFSDGEVEYLWSDGDVLATGERTSSGVSVIGAGNGFHLSVPADITPETLMLYVGVDNGQGQLTVSLSDNSIAPVVDSSLNSGQSNSLNGTYAIDFRASQPGQTLNIDYVLLTDQGNGTSILGGVSLQSAVLLPRLPLVSLTTPLDGQNFTYPAPISAAVDASQVVSAISKVDLFSDSQNPLELTAAPYSFTVNDLTAGDHVLTATATDANGLTGNSDPVLVAEIQGGGSLSATIDVPANVDISAGSTDWVHWGNPDSPNNVDRKAGIAPQISDITALANGDILVADDSSRGGVSYSWNGGVPTDTQAGTTTQVFMQGYKNGFTLTIPADTTLRTAKLYLGFGFGSSRLRASLSDGSATPWINVFSTTDFYNEKVVTFQFQAASAGQKLIISDQIIADGGFAYVDLEAATVTDQNSPVINTVSPTSGGPGTMLTISGSNFGDSPAGTVTLSGSALTVNSWSNSTITATLTGGYSSGPIIVSQRLANSNGFPFTYLGPMITSLIPNAGPPGTLVTIGGQNLGQDPVTVTFDGLQANVISQGPGAIQVTVPSTISLGAKQVVVQTSAGTTNALEFDVVQTPVITALTPNFGINGQKVKIYGANFGLLPADSIISFGGFYATPISWSKSVIETQVPAGFLGGIVTVIVGGQTSNGMPFEVPFRCLTDCNAQRSSLDISPQNLSLVVGESVDLNVVDNLGESVPFPTFTLSDSTLGTVTPGDKSSTFTAAAPGTETITATVGSLTTSTTITIYAGPTLPDGTIKWQLPGSIVGGSAANFVQAQPAVGSATATFVEDLSDPNFNVIIRALDVNGRQLWAWPTQASYFTLFFNPVAPTPNGGFVYTDAGSINAIDANGHPLWSYPFPQYRFEPLTVGYDGTVYALINFDFLNFQSNEAASHLVALDAQRGTEKFRVPLPKGQFVVSGTDHDSSGTTPPENISRPIVLADGSINLAVEDRISTQIDSPNTHQAIPQNNSHDPNLSGPAIYCPSEILECWAPVDSSGAAMTKEIDTTEGKQINLLNIQPDGSYKQYQISNSLIECDEFGSHFQYILDDALLLPFSHVGGNVRNSNGATISDGHQYAQEISSWFTGTCGANPFGPNGFDLMVVPNGTGGLLVASETDDAPNPVWIKNIPNPSASGDGTVITIPELNTVNRIVIGEDGKAFAAGSWNFFETPRLVSFNLSGGINWTYDSPFGTPDSPGYVDIVAAGPNGSLYATEGDFFNQIPEVAFTLDGSGVRTDNPTSSQPVTYIASAGLGSSIWMGANETTTASLAGLDLGFGPLALMPTGTPLPLPGITAFASTIVDAVLGLFPASSASGDEGQSCARLDKATSQTLTSAYTSLKNFLSNSNNCPACDSKIFQPLSMSRNQFLTYLGQEPRFCDGTKSLEQAKTIGQDEPTVAAFFKKEQQAKAGLTAVTVTSGPNMPLWIFFDPNQINNDSSTVDSHFYPSMMFHEALHGYTQKGDGDPFKRNGLCQILNIDRFKVDGVAKFSNCATETIDITIWIEDFVAFPSN